jgi:beta-glucosidase
MSSTPLSRTAGTGSARRRAWHALVVVLALAATACTGASGDVADEPLAASPTPETPRYLDASAPVDERVTDLLGRMTLEEKLGQMTLVEKNALTPDIVSEVGIGAILSGGGGSPRPNTPDAWREMVGAFQDAALSTRLGIPMLYGVDAVHGHNNLRDAVIFPHNVGLGATRDPELVEAIGRATAEETAATDIRWTYAPVLAVPQDIRWGRTYEAFGEDPALVSELGAALVRGLQGDDLTAETSVLATPKHWVGDGGTGWDTSTAPGYRIDQGTTLADEDELRATHISPYPASFDAGAITVMASYSSWENGKVHGDRFLLTDVLRGELGFSGLVVSDWGAVDQVAPGDYYGSVVQSIEAGIDLVMVPTDFELFLTALRGAVEQGDIPEDRIDEAVSRILAVKFRMGLFERPSTSPELVERIGVAEHRALAREAVARSVVVLETDGETLPLEPTSTDTLLVAGTAADDVGIQSGGWTIGWQGDTGAITEGTTILQALQETVAGEIVYDRSGRFSSFEGKAPLGIAVVGERPYAEGRGDSATLALPDTDVDVVTRLRDRVDRLVVVLVTGRPLVAGDVAGMADALVVAWLPGSEGAGVVDVLTGAQPAMGRTPFSWPTDASVLDRDRTGPCDGTLYPYGYGLDLTGSPLDTAATCDGGEG